MRDSSRDCKAWVCLKKGIKDANVQPMALVAKNSGVDMKVPSVAEVLGDDAQLLGKRVDWYTYRVWFMGDSVVQHQQQKQQRDRVEVQEEQEGEESMQSDSSSSRSSSSSPVPNGVCGFDVMTFREWGYNKQHHQLPTGAQVFGEPGRAAADFGTSDKAAADFGTSGVNSGAFKAAVMHRTKQLAGPFDRFVVDIACRAIKDICGCPVKDSPSNVACHSPGDPS